jgi:hypothetical protein
LIGLHEIAGEIMNYLDAFEGSRPALDASNILIVKGKSRKRFPIEETAEILSRIYETLGAEKIDTFSDAGANIISLMDENLRNNVEIQGETDIYGIYRIKKSLEAMNCHVEYALGILDEVGIFIVVWIDKSGFGPKFVEIVVSSIAETED